MLFPILYAAIAVIPAPNEIRCDGNDAVPVSTPIVVKTDASLPAEGYCLAIKPGKKIVIGCSSPAGEFYARQTLRQLAVGNSYPCVTIKDQPA